MKDDPTIRLMWICGGVLLAIGAVLCMSTLDSLRADGATLRARLSELEELRGMERHASRYRGAYRKFDGLSARRPVAMATLLKKHMGGQPVEDSRSTRQSLVRGWTVRRQEMALGEVSMDKVMALVHDAESGRPPWRLTRCIVRASPGGGGKAKVDLVFEALDGE